MLVRLQLNSKPEPRSEGRIGWICLSLSLLLAGGYFLYPPVQGLTERDEGDSKGSVETVELPARLQHVRPPKSAYVSSRGPLADQQSAERRRDSAPKSASLLTPAKPIRETAPEAPEGIRARIEGVIPVDVTLGIGPDGRVVSAHAPVQYDGVRAYFAQSALEAARQWRFRPARRGREAVPSQWTVRFRFYRSGVEWN